MSSSLLTSAIIRQPPDVGGGLTPGDEGHLRRCLVWALTYMTHPGAAFLLECARMPHDFRLIAPSGGRRKSHRVDRGRVHHRRGLFLHARITPLEDAPKGRSGAHQELSGAADRRWLLRDSRTRPRSNELALLLAA